MVALIVVYKLKPGVTGEAFEAWADRVNRGSRGTIGRTEAFVTPAGLPQSDREDRFDFVEVYAIEDLERFQADDLPNHVEESLRGGFRGLVEAPAMRLAHGLD